MRRKRLFLCLLLGIAIVFYGVPYLNFQGDLKTVIFSITWVLFALAAISGNLIALLYGKRVNRRATTTKQIFKQQKKQKVRQYG
ncbi:hypothetical protein BKP35_12710 [Anaerobacillus arseniciselenatis]|uniref:Uncharacterized protein n=1 Tax=Anaerobacillus arseniciselenatis TaxID=85682 RepID=A0A1S2LFU8_9BACI|nr:hypothetical protein [Anaerobacillus arseniciselenatis]OIJ10943.1 hypothetical protein BKP35_12710 [Anaerobacillus arseniciselenatis]